MLEFFKNKKVFITGHTGFKGIWLSYILLTQGADVTGYSLEPSDKECLYYLTNIKKDINSHIGDVRDYEHLCRVFNQSSPEIVIHLAAQPLVRESYKNPRYTFETNIMGTVNLLECIKNSNTVKSLVNVTTDKVYKNNEWSWGYREDDIIFGGDPYSNSKSCSELVTKSYADAFLMDKGVSVSTVRAGNVIGGGDFSKDRIIPDCIKYVRNKETIVVRNPNSVRPYQHVLEPLYAYLMIAQKQYENNKYSGQYNIGPDDNQCITTGELVDLFCKKWGSDSKWINVSQDNIKEASFLKLDISKIKTTFKWKPKWNIEKAIDKTIEWTKAYLNNEDIETLMRSQILDYEEYGE